MQAVKNLQTQKFEHPERDWGGAATHVMKGTAHWASQTQGTPSVQTFTPFWTQHEFWMSSTRACNSASLVEHTPLAK